MLQIMTCSKIYAASSQQEVLDGNGKVKNKTIPNAQAKVEASVKRNENNLWRDGRGWSQWRLCRTIYEQIASRNLAAHTFIPHISLQINEFNLP